jgi:hypothetical protein
MKEDTPNDWIEDIRELGASYVGTGANARFLRYLDDSMKFSVHDVLDRFDEIVGMFDGVNRDKKSEILNTLKNMDLNNLSDLQKDNLKKFMLIVHKDEAVSFMLKLLDSDYKYMMNNDEENDLVESFLSDERFLFIYDAIQSHAPKVD